MYPSPTMIMKAPMEQPYLVHLKAFRPSPEDLKEAWEPPIQGIVKGSMGVLLEEVVKEPSKDPY